MKQCTKKMLAFLLALAIVATLFAAIPMTATAAEEENVLPDQWKVVTEDFEDPISITSANEDLTKDQVFDTGAVYSYGNIAQVKSVSVIKDPANADNKVLRVQTGTTSRYNILPKDFAANYYNFTFDVYWNYETNDIYNGFYLCHSGCEGKWLFQVTDSFVRTYCGDDANNQESGSDSKGIADSEDIMNFASKANYNTWLTMRYVRNGNTISLKIWEKGKPENVLYNESRAFACTCGQNASIPVIRFVQDASVNAESAWILLDNLRYENNTGELACVATQTSGVTDGKYAVRFIGTVDSESYQKVGFDIVASYEENGVAKRKHFVLEDCTVYTSILASYGNEVYTAPDLGGKYLIALSIYDIPVSCGSITFEAKATGMTDAAEVVESKCIRIMINKIGVSPQMFGAKGDGVTDDTAAINQAIAYAKANAVSLCLPEAEYYTSEPIKLDNINVESENAKILFYGQQASVPAIDMYSNVNITGKLRIWTDDNTVYGVKNHGGRAALGFGNYGTGVGAHNCYVEDVEVSGGYNDSNGVFITGDSSQITIDKITVIGNNIIGRGVLLHWGNADQHYPEVIDGQITGNYLHAENADYTTHPHDIRIGTVICNNLSLDVASNAVFLSAAYNVTVNEIIADQVHDVLTVHAGDGGFSYASPAEQLHGSKNVIVKKITATNVRQNGIVYTKESGYNDIPTAYGELVIGSATLSFIDGHATVGPTVNGIDRLLIDELTLKNIQGTTFYLINACNNIRIGTLTLENCSTSAAVLFNIETTMDKYLSQDIGLNGLLVQNLIFKNSGYGTVFSIRESTKNVHLQNMTLIDSALSGSIFNAKRAVPAENHLTVGRSDYGVSLTAGQSCTVNVEPDMLLMGSGETVSWAAGAEISK